MHWFCPVLEGSVLGSALRTGACAGLEMEPAGSGPTDMAGDVVSANAGLSTWQCRASCQIFKVV